MAGRCQSVVSWAGFQGSLSAAAAFPTSTPRPSLFLLSLRYPHRPKNPVMISTALLTTRTTNGSPSQSAALSLRSLSLLRQRRQQQQQQPRAPTPLPNSLIPSHMTHNPNLGALALFSSDGAPGKKPRGGRAGMLATAVTAGAVLLGKGKYILGALKLTKFASLGSMVLSVGAYSMFFGLPYAVGIVGLILVHESKSVALDCCFVLHCCFVLLCMAVCRICHLH
jgi:hypothetical protein